MRRLLVFEAAELPGAPWPSCINELFATAETLTRDAQTPHPKETRAARFRHAARAPHPAHVDDMVERPFAQRADPRPAAAHRGHRARPSHAPSPRRAQAARLRFPPALLAFG